MKNGRNAVVFDLDGTLVDSIADMHAATAVFLAERRHAPLDLKTVTGFVGHGVSFFLEDVLRTVGEAADRDAVQAALPRFLEIYGAAPSALSQLFPGVVDSLDALREAGYALGICTNKLIAPARDIVADLGIAGYFSAVVGGASLPQRKPDPAPLRETAALLGIAAEAIAYVGDSEVDAATAKAAAVPFLLFTEGYRKSPVEALAPDASFSHFGELPGLCSRLFRGERPLRTGTQGEPQQGPK